MKLKCLIIDDEPIARKLLTEYIEETDFLELVGNAGNPLKATGLINSLKSDLVFLDINMPKNERHRIFEVGPQFTYGNHDYGLRTICA